MCRVNTHIHVAMLLREFHFHFYLKLNDFHHLNSIFNYLFFAKSYELKYWRRHKQLLQFKIYFLVR